MKEKRKKLIHDIRNQESEKKSDTKGIEKE